MANRPWSGVEVFVNAHNGTFKGPVLYPTLDTPADMAIADFTGNGRNERVVVHNGWQNAGVLLHQFLDLMEQLEDLTDG